MTLHHIFLQLQDILVCPASQESTLIVEIRSELSSPDGAIWNDVSIATNPPVGKVYSLSISFSWFWNPSNDGAQRGHLEIVNAVFVVVNVFSVLLDHLTIALNAVFVVVNVCLLLLSVLLDHLTVALNAVFV